MTVLRSVDLDFLSSAPLRVTRSHDVNAPAPVVFHALADDPAAWGAFFPGFDSSGRWDTPAPHGPGSRRTVKVAGQSTVEQILAIDPETRFAFHVVEAKMPGVRAFAEDYRVSPEGDERCRLTWTMALDMVGPVILNRPVVGVMMAAILPRVARGLARHLAT